MVCNGFVYNGRGNQHVNDNLTIFIENDRCTVLLSNRQQNEQRCVFVVERLDIVLLSNRQQKVVMQFNLPTLQGKLYGQSASTYHQIIIEIVFITAVL